MTCMIKTSSSETVELFFTSTCACSLKDSIDSTSSRNGNSIRLCFVCTDLKRNDYTPDKIIFPQDESPELTIQPGSCTKESDSANSIRLML